MQNNQQLMDNITQQADKIIETELSQEEDDVKAEFKRIYTRNCLASYMDFSQIERFIETARVNVESRKEAQAEESDGSDESDMMDEY